MFFHRSLLQCVVKDLLPPTSISTLISSLKACSSRASREDAKSVNGRLVREKSLEQGREIHSRAAGLRDLFVANTLLDMYAKCGSMEDAHRVFDAMPGHNLVSWNALMLGYAENGNEEVCIQLLSCVFPGLRSPRTYAIAFKACSRLASKADNNGDVELVRNTALETGMALHRQASQSGFDSEMFVAGSLIDMYAKCGSLCDARKVFDTVPCHDVVCWNSLMLGYVENGEEETALALFARLGGLTDNLSFVAAFRACAGLAAKHETWNRVTGATEKWELLERGRIIDDEYTKRIKSSGTYVETVTSIVTMFSRCGSMAEAQRAFDSFQVESHDAVSWTALMSGYVENKQELQALEVFAKMARVCLPNARAFVVAVKACTRLAAREGSKLCKLGYLEKGMEIHSRAARGGFDKETIVSNALIDMYAQCGSLFDARAVVDRMEQHDEVSWNLLLLGYSRNGEQELALELFELLINSRRRSVGRSAFAAALKCCAVLAEKDDGERIDGKLVKLGPLEKAMWIHSQAISDRLDSDRIVASALVDAYARCGSVLDARMVFDIAVLRKEDDIVSWTSIMLALADNNEEAVALELFQRIKHQPWWYSPDPQTLVAALKACGSSPDSARRIHAESCRHGLEEEEALASCLIDTYGRAGRTRDSQLVFDSLHVEDPLTWTALIAGYSRAGEPGLVFRWLSAMVDEETAIDSVTCVSVLAACSHAGLVDTGKKFLAEMETTLGIKPDVYHYCCLIDALGRANRLEEAVETLETMPVDPNAVAWTTLLTACAKWKNTTLGRVAFERVLGMPWRQFPLL